MAAACSENTQSSTARLLGEVRDAIGVQIPIGMLLDRFGPRRVQGALLIVAAAGAALFGASGGFVTLLIARAMIGIGIAAALMAGLKAIVMQFPRERIPLVNGYMVMTGAYWRHDIRRWCERL